VHERVQAALIFSALALLAFMPLEWLHTRRSPWRTGWRADLLFASVGQVLAEIGIAVGVGSCLAYLEVIAFEQSIFDAIATPKLRLVSELCVGLFVFELAGYAYHRAAHRLPWLWRLHRVHHSSTHLDALASFRQHPLEIVLLTLAQNAPLVLLGISLGSHTTLLLLLRLNTVFVHANLTTPRGPHRLLLASPEFHHRHHAPDGEHTNFASVLPAIDWIFGTHYSEDEAKLVPATALGRSAFAMGSTGGTLAPGRCGGKPSSE